MAKMKSISLNIENQKVWVRFQEIGHELWIHFEGQTWVEDLRPVRSKTSKSKKGTGRSESLAPMPGKILQVCVGVGQKVEIGNVLVIMEAMKMEYTLEAEVAGIVEKVNCKTGDQVELGSQLVKLKN